MNVASEVVTPIHGHMSKQDYDRERAKLRGLYGDSRKEAGARFEQALARLFNISGWTLAELAERERKGKAYISYQLIFGRFLGFYDLSTSGGQTEKGAIEPPIGLTERRFRHFWNQTEGGAGSSGGNERIRFREVLRLIEEDAAIPKVKDKSGKELGKRIATRFADGKWHDIEVIAKLMGVPFEDAEAVLENIRHKKSFQRRAEKKEVKNTRHWRLFPLEKQVSTLELAERLADPLKNLAEQGNANMATMSPQTVAYWTAMIRQMLKEFIERP